MNAPANLSINEKIRARDGDRCWLCDGKLDFKAEPNSSKAPTREHLLAVSLGGTSELANLVLCHPGCNKQLGTRPVAEKHAMRAKRQADRAKLAATQQAKKQAADKAKVQAAAVSPSQPKTAPPPKSAVAASPTRPDRQNLAPQPSWETLRHWQIATVVAVGAACLCLGFSIGILVR